MVVEKHVVWYLQDTIEYELGYVRVERIFLQEYDDSDWVTSANRKRTLGCYRKRTSVALSATEDEYIVAANKIKEDSSSDEEYVL